ncbi:MAG: flavodoxin [Tissierellia bacterium]|nr:flavodoxin [Tissierellia bacterium]
MKSILVYSSKTGNTERLAKAIHSTLPEGTEFKSVDEIDNFDDYETVIVGFHVINGKVDKKAQAVLDQLKGKKVGLFATTGLLFLGGKAITEARDQIEENNELLCAYICPGRIDPAVEGKFKEAFPKYCDIIDDAHIPEDVGAPLDKYLEEAKNLYNQSLK